MSDYALQRLNMVESQVRASDVVDRRIIRAMLSLPREEFVPQAYRSVCYTDRDLPLSAANEGGAARAILAPRVQARLIQALDLDDDAIVLDIGCGLGYSTAVLARMIQTVIAVEADPEMVAAAQATLESLEIDNVAVMVAPLNEGQPEEGPFDGILINGAVDFVPDAILDQLKDGGKLATIVVDGAIGHVTEWARTGGHFGSRRLFEADVVRLPGFEKEVAFVF